LECPRAEELAKMIPKARVVSAFNTVPSEVLFGVFDARRRATRPSLVYCGDDSSSKAVDWMEKVSDEHYQAGAVGYPRGS